MNRIHLRPDWRRGLESALGGSALGVAEAIAKNVRSQGITVGDVDGGRHEIPLPVKVYHRPLDGPDLVQYTRADGTSRVATRAQALAWGGSFSEIGEGGGGKPGTWVVLAHPAGVAVQAKHGALTRAASAVGHEVHG